MSLSCPEVAFANRLMYFAASVGVTSHHASRNPTGRVDGRRSAADGQRTVSLKIRGRNDSSFWLASLSSYLPKLVTFYIEISNCTFEKSGIRSR